MSTKSNARSANVRLAELMFDTMCVGLYFGSESKEESASLKPSAAETIRTL